MLNKVQLIGFTGAEAEVRTTSGGKKVATLKGSSDEIAGRFLEMVEDYVQSHYAPMVAAGTT